MRAVVAWRSWVERVGRAEAARAGVSGRNEWKRYIWAGTRCLETPPQSD